MHTIQWLNVQSSDKKKINVSFLYIYKLVKYWNNSSAIGMELQESCVKPSKQFLPVEGDLKRQPINCDMLDDSYTC